MSTAPEASNDGVGVALAGGLVGAASGITILAGGTYVVLAAVVGEPTGGLEDFGFWVFVGFAWLVGSYVGLMVGCWYALRRRGYDSAAATARWSVAFALTGWLVSGVTSALGEALGLSVVAVGFATYLAALIAAPALGRALVCRSRQRSRSPS